MCGQVCSLPVQGLSTSRPVRSASAKAFVPYSAQSECMAGVIAHEMHADTTGEVNRRRGRGLPAEEHRPSLVALVPGPAAIRAILGSEYDPCELLEDVDGASTEGSQGAVGRQPGQGGDPSRPCPHALVIASQLGGLTAPPPRTAFVRGGRNLASLAVLVSHVARTPGPVQRTRPPFPPWPPAAPLRTSSTRPREWR